MKNKILIIWVLFQMFYSCGFHIPTVVKEDVNWVEILDAPGITKDDLYIYVNSWMVHSFVSREGVIQFEDKEHGKTIAKFLLSETEEDRVYMVIDFDIKNESIRMTMAGSVNTYQQTEKNIKWKERQMAAGLPTHDDMDVAKATWDVLVSSLVDYINSIDEDW